MVSSGAGKQAFICSFIMIFKKTIYPLNLGCGIIYFPHFETYIVCIWNELKNKSNLCIMAHVVLIKTVKFFPSSKPQGFKTTFSCPNSLR